MDLFCLPALRFQQLLMNHESSRRDFDLTTVFKERFNAIFDVHIFSRLVCNLKPTIDLTR